MWSDIVIFCAKINYAQNKIAPGYKVNFATKMDVYFQNAYLKQKSLIICW